MAMSTDGEAPGARRIDARGARAVLPDDLDTWMDDGAGGAARLAGPARADGRTAAAALETLIALYARRARPGRRAGCEAATRVRLAGRRRPWRSGAADAPRRRAAGRADVVLYDALVDPAALALAPHAQRISSASAPAARRSRQDFINRLLVRAARRGQRVVRLKGGDPFVFGRGGEEALALAAAGFRSKWCPGSASAIAAPALAGIPVTHRGIATGVRRRLRPRRGRPTRRSSKARSAEAPTLVVLMGLGRIDQIARLPAGPRLEPRHPGRGPVRCGHAAARAHGSTTLGGTRARRAAARARARRGRWSSATSCGCAAALALGRIGRDHVTGLAGEAKADGGNIERESNGSD